MTNPKSLNSVTHRLSVSLSSDVLVRQRQRFSASSFLLRSIVNSTLIQTLVLQIRVFGGYTDCNRDCKIGIVIERKIMKGGRKNLKRAAEEQSLTVQDGQSVMQVVSLRGSNLIEVMDAQGEKSLALFPAKFQKSMWIKRGSFVVVDESGKEKALKDGSKVACIVTKVLFYEQVRTLQKSSEWPEIFKSTNANDSNETLDSQTSQPEENNESDLADDDDDEEDEDDDGLPPLEANTNRINPFEWHSEPDSGSDTDTDSCTKEHEL